MTEQRRLDDALVSRLNALPRGHSEVRLAGRRYRVNRQDHADGRSLAVQASAADGSNWISFNAYRLADGVHLRPCEMPLDTVTGFLASYTLLSSSGPRDTPR